MKSVLIVGAGMLGKGFAGESFGCAGWKVAYLDNDMRVIENLKNPDGFNVVCSYADRTEIHHMTGYETFFTDEAYSAQDFAIHCDVIMMPLYPKDYDDACAYLAHMLSERSRVNPDQYLDIITVNNFNHYIPHVEEQFLKGLDSDAARKWFAEKVYLRDSIIRRSTIADSNYALNLRTMMVATLLIQPPLHNDLDAIEWLETRDKLELLKDMKVYTVNSVHATFAFSGYRKGYTLIEQGMDDPEICEHIEQVINEATWGLTHEFPLTNEDVDDMFGFMRIKLDTPINDTVLRVAWDPIRKLSRHDRLTGNACYCYEHGMEPTALMRTMAYAFAYDEKEDPKAMIIQKMIKDKGILSTVSEITGLPADHHIVQCVVKEYEALEK